MKKPVVLVILDGCGLRNDSDGNAFLNANKPTFDYLWNNFAHSTLQASGVYVGLPDGQMGNSEVGHLNIGAGRVVYQPLEIINRSISDGSFYNNEKILDCINHVKNNNSKLHVVGLLSDGGVHSHINHLKALIKLCKDNNVTVYLHAVTDGRDVSPKSALTYLNEIKEFDNVVITSVSGRYYAMDRDNNFDRLKLSYDAIVYNEANKFNNYEDGVNDSYNNGITDEFIHPFVLNDVKLSDNDAIITFNFRKDRLRELFTLLTNPNEYKSNANEKGILIKEFNNLKCLTMMSVVDSVKCPYAFEDMNLENIMGEYLEKNNLNQLRIAETEKYAHVTFFYDGGHEEEYSGMKKILIPSPKVATYDLMPEMSAGEVTDTLLKELDNDIYDVVILNYANGDMVGHTGNYEAAKKAVEYLDTCLKKLYDKISALNGTLVICADHGNCDIMWDKDKNPVTSHTTNPVPFIITRNDIKLADGSLCDIAPTMLELLNIEKPIEMTGKSLIIK